MIDSAHFELGVGIIFVFLIGRQHNIRLSQLLNQDAALSPIHIGYGGKHLEGNAVAREAGSGIDQFLELRPA